MSPLSFSEAAERVKSSLDIFHIVQRYVILKKSGRSFIGKCPFHADKSPSMNVNPEKGIFKCFACGVGGDALTFLMRIENKTFGEIIRDLAQEQGIDIAADGRRSESTSVQRDQRQKILDLNQQAAQWFVDRLAEPEAAGVMDYLKSRYPDSDWQERACRMFRLGYAPTGWDHLSNYLKTHVDFVQANPDLLGLAGLANPREHGQGHYDRFRHRLMIPIADEKGQIVAFGGRTLTEDEKPKYLNSPETMLYKKSQILYGMDQAKESIRERKAAVVMEGYFDVITAHLAGITEAVGSCGTAMTESHLRVLTRFGVETVYLAFDSDEAGIRAAMSAIALIEPYLDVTPLQVKVLVVPERKDPDAFILQNGGEAFRALMSEASPFLAFKLNIAIRGIETTTSEGRIQAANRITPILAGIRNATTCAEYLKDSAEKIGVPEEALALEVKRYLQNQNAASRKNGLAVLNSAQKKGNFQTGSTSFKRDGVRLTENMTELRTSLTFRQAVAEKNLLQLTLYSVQSFEWMKCLFESNPDLTFENPRYQIILNHILEFDPTMNECSSNDFSSNDFLGTLMAKMNHLYTEQPELPHQLAELAFASEQFGQSLGLDQLTGEPLQEKLSQITQQQIQLLQFCKQTRMLRQLQSQNNFQDIEAEIQLNYTFQEQYRSLSTNNSLFSPLCPEPAQKLANGRNNVSMINKGMKNNHD